MLWFTRSIGGQFVATFVAAADRVPKAAAPSTAKIFAAAPFGLPPPARTIFENVLLQ